MKRIYITPEIDICETYTDCAFLDSFSEPKGDSSGTETPGDDDWGTNEFHSLWDKDL